jgi:hypothetical protein
MFASKTLAEHLVRGAIGIGAVVVVLYVSSTLPPWLDIAGRIVLTLTALLALRGCPMCWLMGLFETLMGRQRSCVDGSCERR